MPEEFKNQNPKREYPDSLEKTFDRLIEFVSSEKTSEQIANICVRNGVEDEGKIEEVAYRITWSLLGKLPKENLAFALEKGAELPTETAKKIADEANRSIVPQDASPKIKRSAPPEEEKPKEEPKKPPKKDIYKEPIE